ncbi:NUDIX hydrolase, partial [Aeromicrobium sp. REDSEA-S32_B7]|uniref:NUDIX hydrolase n=1 Tax=Aeromicrobium sp. REDSEA-S32_B7 TaxID=1811526 RepID=UPI000A7CA960
MTHSTTESAVGASPAPNVSHSITVRLEVPAGGVEDGEVSEEAVLRELQEEIGYTADSLLHLSSFWVAPGWATEYMHAYLATGLRESRLDGDEDENIEVVRVPFD